MANFKHILAAVGMTAAAALAPATASAQSYEYLDCKKSDKDAQVIGGLLGAAIGGLAGHEIAGRGDTTEGAVIGAIAGAAAGAGIADDRRNCTREEYATTRGTVRTTDYRTSGYSVPSSTVYGGNVHQVSHPGHGRRGYNSRNNRRNDYGGYTRARDVRYRIETLKNEDRRLKRRQKYEYAPWIDRRRDEIRWEVKRLKRVEDRLQDRRDYRRDDRRRRDVDYGRRHYHGSNVCYSNH